MKKVLLFGILATLLMSFGLAQISLSEPEEIYNLGEKIYIDIEGIKGQENGNLNVDLVCDGEDINLLTVSARAFSKTSESSYSLPYKYLTKEDLEVENIDLVLGDCILRATIGSDSFNTDSFIITNNLNLDIGTKKSLYNPGESVILSMDVSKKNGNLFEGFYAVSGLFEDVGAVNSNEELMFEISDSEEAGDRNIIVEVYDYDSERKKQNQQIEEITIKINQVPTEIITGLAKQTFSPEDKITITSELKDQSGEEIKKELKLTVKSANGELSEYSLISGGFVEVELPANADAGTWEIVSSYNGLESKVKSFEVLEVPKLNYSINDGLLVVKNVGNCLYQGNLNISIGDYEETFYVKLDKGLIKTFNLEAPEGNYEVSIFGAEEEYTSSTFLTGNAISIEGEERSIQWGLIFLIVLLIIVLVFVGIWVRKKSKEKPKKVRKSWKERKRDEVQEYQEKENKKRQIKKSKEFDFRKTGNSAESSLVLGGSKSLTSVIAINVKNHDSMKPITKENLYGIVTSAIKEKGVFEYKDGFIYVLFNPIITRTYHNEILAVQVAQKIFGDLTTYNKKYKEKIEFGLGIHSGNLVVNKEKNKLQYTGLEDTVPMTKKIASLGEEGVLISEDVRNKLLRQIKTEVVDKVNTKQVYRVKEIKNLAANQEKLKEIMKRMDK